jgi:aminotransferase
MRDSYISQKVSMLRPSGIRKFFDIAATMKEVISLGIGEPDFTTPDAILEAGIRSLQKGETHYTSNSGITALRVALAEHLEKLYGVTYHPDHETVITVGGSEALYLTFTAILDPGDEVVVLTPCFVAYQAEVFLAGGVPVEVACRMEDNFDINVEAVRKAITPRTKAILIGYPNNPTGAVATRETLLAIQKLAEAHDLIVVSDEIYDQLVYGGHEHVCYAALPGARERTVLLGGFSKDYAMTGWRIGFAAAPKEILQAMLRVHQYTIMCAPTTAQEAAVTALKHCNEDVARMRSEYDRRRRLIVGEFNRIGLPTFEPKGAFYAFPKVSVTGLDDDTFANRLLQEEHVAVVPGAAFGAGGEGFVRCSYATAYEKIEEALRRIERFVNRI